jgi:uncharacterized protein YggU (UPF0235/DUF167 family)
MKILIEVKLKSKKSGVEKLDENSYIVYTTKVPKNNESNKDILEQLSKYFKVAKTRIEIILGKTTKKKIVKIDLTKN